MLDPLKVIARLLALRPAGSVCWCVRGMLVGMHPHTSECVKTQHLMAEALEAVE